MRIIELNGQLRTTFKGGQVQMTRPSMISTRGCAAAPFGQSHGPTIGTTLATVGRHDLRRLCVRVAHGIPSRRRHEYSPRPGRSRQNITSSPSTPLRTCLAFQARITSTMRFVVIEEDRVSPAGRNQNYH